MRKFVQQIGDHQEFIVVAKSSGTNSFGLHGYILVARDGSAWEVGRTLCFPWQAGQVINVQLSQGRPVFEGCEIPERKPNCPPEVVKKIWKNTV